MKQEFVSGNQALNATNQSHDAFRKVALWQLKKKVPNGDSTAFQAYFPHSITPLVSSNRNDQEGRRMEKSLIENYETASIWLLSVPASDSTSERFIPVSLWPLPPQPQPDYTQDRSNTPKANDLFVHDLLLLNCRIRIGGHTLARPVSMASIVEASTVILEPYIFSVESFDKQASVKSHPQSNTVIYAREVLLDIAYVSTGMIIQLTINGTIYRYAVSRCKSILNESVHLASTVFRVRKQTRVLISAKANETSKPALPNSPEKYKDIGGLGEQISRLKELVETPLYRPELFTQYELAPPKGILLYGPPGTGKTMLARAVATETGASVVAIQAADLSSPYHGENEAKLTALFSQAKESSPCIIFIDELDTICPKREGSTESQQRLATTLLTLMDGMDDSQSYALEERDHSSCRYVVIAATNRPNAIDEAFRRPGRFDVELEVGIPNAQSRLDILRALLKRLPHTLSDDDVQHIAAVTHGYVGADLAGICKEAGLHALKRVLFAHSGEQTSLTIPGDIKISAFDMESGRTFIKPSAMREIVLEVPKVLWTDIGGQKETISKLKEAVEWPLRHPEAFTRFNIRPPKGILLYGPPGCSKTLMAKALATETGLNFIAVKGPELFSKWVGESEKAVREIFKKARAASPSIIFFDEIDSLAVKRSSDEMTVTDRVLAQFLTELDGIEPLAQVTVIAATNRPDFMDPALLRPGRIDRILYVPPPNLANRREIFRIQFRTISVSDDVDIDDLAVMSDGFSGAEVVAVCQEAALVAMEESVSIAVIHHRHFSAALLTIKPRISAEMIQFYNNFRNSSGLTSI